MFLHADQYFYSYNSVGDHGTLFQLRTKLNRTNVVNVPKNNMNADFMETITSGLVVAAAMSTLHLESADDVPSQDIFPGVDTIWMLSKEERSERLMKVCAQVYDNFIKFSFNSDQMQLERETVIAC